jgi:hypothetical protein
METFGDVIKQKISKKYCCKLCDYETSRKSNMDNHFQSAKHQNNVLGDTGDKNKQILSKIKQNCSNLICENCNKQYMSRNGLWKHKTKGCHYNTVKKEDISKEENNQKSNEPTDKDLIMILIKENSELKNMMMKVIENGTHNNISNNSNTITNSNNKTFNLNFFLNETCKNAMNINDFVDSIKLQLSDLESVGRLGYIEGLSKIIIKNLNALDVTERPIHCSDPKRDTMYVKDEDKWEKDSEENPTVLKAIEDIANKNTKQVKEWKIKNPECASSKSCKADQYSHIVIEVVCSNNDANNKKVLNKLAKEVTIDKS